MVDADGNVDDTPFGDAPVGFIMYTTDDHMSVLIRPSTDRGPVAYAGGFSVHDDHVMHLVEVGLPPVEGPQKRWAVIEGDRLTLSTAAEGEQPRAQIFWQRAD
jgi:hypothetical protein